MKADVKAAFLQGDCTEAGRQLYAKPVPELGAAMGLKPHEVVQVIKACYGLVSAQPLVCVWCATPWLPLASGNAEVTLACGSFQNLVGRRYRWVHLRPHVDDFLIAGNEDSETWVNALSQFYERFKWSPWEFSSYSHCGVKIKEECDFSYTLDHSAFCENIEQIQYKPRADHEPLNAEEMTQLRGALGAIQWRAHQSGPHLSARLGQLQSEISRATISTAKAANKLVRECFSSRHLSTRINQLQVDDPKQVVFVAWSDAALANRIDLSSTGGFVVAAASPDLLHGERHP